MAVDRGVAEVDGGCIITMFPAKRRQPLFDLIEGALP